MHINPGDEPLDAEALEVCANVAEQVKSTMRLRDEFAIAAMQSLILKVPLHDRQGEHGLHAPEIADIHQVRIDIAESAYDYAAAMLSARKAKPT